MCASPHCQHYPDRHTDRQPTARPPGVVFFQFSRIRAQSQNGSVFMTGQQQEWVELSKMVFRLKPPDKCPVPRNRIRRRAPGPPPGCACCGWP